MMKPKPKCMGDCVARGTAICHTNDCEAWAEYQTAHKAYKKLIESNKKATKPDALNGYLNEKNRGRKE